MTAVPKPRKLTEDEYLAIESTAEFKSEFYAGEMFAMSGASLFHNRAKDNLAFRLKFSDVCRFVFRQHMSVSLCQCQFMRHQINCRLVIPGKDH